MAQTNAEMNGSTDQVATTADRWAKKNLLLKKLVELAICRDEAGPDRRISVGHLPVQALRGQIYSEMTGMRRYQKLTVEELVEVYATIGVEQADAIDDYDNQRFSRLYKHRKSIEEELRSRPGDARRALMRLYEHGNPQTRLNAAQATLALTPLEARRVLQDLVDSHVSPQGPDASFTLSGLDSGFYKPT